MKDIFLTRAKENLNAASVLFDHGFYNASANRSYYCAFHISLATILEQDLQPAIDHRTVLSMFCNEFINKKKLFQSTLKRIIYKLQDARNKADYGSGISSKSAYNRLKESIEYFNTVSMEMRNDN